MTCYFHKYRRERGYVLLVLLLSVALLSIGLLSMIETIEFQIRRDREEELIHRGVEYSRAVRRYVKKFGRYPNSLEALENSTNGRFLRKRYKDPVTGKDFMTLHYGDLEAFNASVSPGSATSTEASAAIEQASGRVVPEGLSPTEAIDTQGIPVTNPGVTAQAEQTASNPVETATEQPPGDAGPQGAAEDTGGIAVIGVASYSQKESIRIFNKKDHYNQWQFVYDPGTDSGIMTGPNQPLLKGVANTQPQGVPGETQDSGTNRGQK
jgi:type II secretory pathway pseudopilin PulG